MEQQLTPCDRSEISTMSTEGIQRMAHADADLLEEYIDVSVHIKATTVPVYIAALQARRRDVEFDVRKSHWPSCLCVIVKKESRDGT